MSSSTFKMFNYFFILAEQKAREDKEKELEDVNKKAEDALETIKQLAADRDQLKEKIDELEKNINELINLVQRHSDGKQPITSYCRSFQFRRPV